MAHDFKLKELKIEVTQKCPLNCLHCSSEANITKTQELSEELIIRLINEAIMMGVEEITFSGGEPLIWPPIFCILEYCSTCRIGFSLYTTGNPIIDNSKLLESLKDKKLDKVTVSLFGANSEAHERITRIKGSFDKSVTAIKIFRDLGASVGIHFVAMNPNWTELEGVVELANQHNVSTVSILRFVPHGRGAMVDHYNLTKEELRELRKRILKLRATSQSYIRLGSPFNILLLNEKVDCTAACDRLIIGSNGKVYPCDAFKNIDSEGELSSIIENSLIDVWNGSEYLNEVRKLVVQGLGPECSKCKSCLLCKGGCLAQKVIRLPDGVLKPDPDCII